EAVSRSQAAGIWQFIPSTGTYMGLEQNHWYDGRRDIVASTEAAVRYFNRLRKIFNDDWPVIIAAYNGGEGTLSRAIAANKSAGKPTDFWSLTQIPNETANYPARFYALVDIFSQPEKYGFTPESTPLSPTVVQLEFNGPLHLGRLAELTGIEKKNFLRLNPGYKRLITGPGQHSLLVPREHASRFTEEILAKASENISDWGLYIVQRGDSLSSIARRFGMTVAELRQINMLSESVARPGTDLLVPRGRPGAIDTLQAQIDAGAKAYRVQKGDSLWAIARRFNTSISQLRSLNALDESRPLQIGQLLLVKAAPADAVAARNSAEQQAADTYVVQPGDSLWAIARRFSVTVEQIKRWNGIEDQGTLHPGQVLTISSGQPEA
ncbi:MAG TPA: LysM peptidoglycan-binding domain-containing protein, partial [Halothiobacillus sp.]|nr:LysM peptidoglycan-binding domain-containing protein [Halothiobacillus sp.]